MTETTPLHPDVAWLRDLHDSGRLVPAPFTIRDADGASWTMGTNGTILCARRGDYAPGPVRRLAVGVWPLLAPTRGERWYVLDVAALRALVSPPFREPLCAVCMGWGTVPCDDCGGVARYARVCESCDDGDGKQACACPAGRPHGPLLPLQVAGYEIDARQLIAPLAHIAGDVGTVAIPPWDADRPRPLRFEIGDWTLALMPLRPDPPEPAVGTVALGAEIGS